MILTREDRSPYLSPGQFAETLATISARVAEGDRAFMEGFALWFVMMSQWESHSFETPAVIGRNGLCSLRTFHGGTGRWYTLATVPVAHVGALRTLRGIIYRCRGWK